MLVNLSPVFLEFASWLELKQAGQIEHKLFLADLSLKELLVQNFSWLGS